MADQDDKLDITPRVIETGTQVIQIAHVTSAGFGTVHPFRPVGLALILVGAGLVATEFIRGGMGAFTLSRAGSPMLWVAFAAAGIGLFLTVFARRFLIVRTVDGARSNLPAGDEEAATEVIGRIRAAIEAGAGAPMVAGHVPGLEAGQGSPLSIGVDRATRTGPPQRSLPPASQGSGQVRGLPSPDPRMAGAGQTQPIGQSRRPDGYVNGHGGTHGDPAHGQPDGGDHRRQLSEYVPPRGAGEHSLPPHDTGPLQMDHGERGQRGPMAPRDLYGSPPVSSNLPHREDPAQDLRRLIEHVRLANVQHKEALLELLKVVDDHYLGRASREDALAHWRSFADYVAQYLGNVEGLLPLTERFGHHMLTR
jgi:hypothetical protein